MKKLALAIVLTFAFGVAGSATAAPQCKTGVPCGNTCIAKGKTCHIKPAALQCKTGIPCGNSCIAKGKKCTK
jgi:hypothetical protein